MNLGAYDYVPKPFDMEELKETIRKALELKTLEAEKQRLDDELKKTLHFGRIVGNSPQMMHVYKLIVQAAPTRTNILITGESGTGKELLARAIHAQSDRSGRPFVVINCAGIPETLMESELFGHKKGAFTGATQDKMGLFAAADRGTLFLDEVGEISPRFKSSCSGPSRSGSSSPWETTRTSRRTSVSSRPPTSTWKPRSSPVVFERIFSIGSTSSRSGCRRCARERATCDSWPSIFWKSTPG